MYVGSQRPAALFFTLNASEEDIYSAVEAFRMEANLDSPIIYSSKYFRNDILVI